MPSWASTHAAACSQSGVDRKSSAAVEVCLPAEPGHGRDERHRRPLGQLLLVDESLQQVTFRDEVDQHDPRRPVGDARAREHRADGSFDLVGGSVDARLVAQVDLDELVDRVVDVGHIHHDDLGTRVAHCLRRSRAHAGRPADHEHTPAVVPELFETHGPTVTVGEHAR